MNVTTVRLRPEVEKGLDALASKQRRSKSWLVNQAVEAYIGQQQDAEQRWQETVAAMQSVARGEVASGEAVRDWLQSWGRDDELPAPKVGG